MTRKHGLFGPRADIISHVPLPIVVAINPTAAFGKYANVGHPVVERLRDEGYTVIGIREANAVELERSTRAALADGARGLIVVGGDGMVSLGVNVLAGTDIPLGIVSTGTGNDLARGLDLPVGDPEASLDLLVSLLRLEPRRIDSAVLKTPDGQQRYFAGVLSGGFDAIVNERANRMRFPRGPSRYIFAMLFELIRMRARHYRVTVDGVTRDIEAVLIAVANNGQFGGGMRICPDALLDDGELDLFFLHKIGRLGLLRAFPRVFSGTHVTHPRVEFVRGKSVRIELADVRAYADGEPTWSFPLTVEVVPRSLRVFAPGV